MTDAPLSTTDLAGGNTRLNTIASLTTGPSRAARRISALFASSHVRRAWPRGTDITAEVESKYWRVVSIELNARGRMRSVRNSSGEQAGWQLLCAVTAGGWSLGAVSGEGDAASSACCDHG
jgi:hypothetical protein